MNRQIRADTKGPAAVGGAIALVHPPIIPCRLQRAAACPAKPARYNRRVHFVYIVRCADGTLYTGYARDPLAREQAHNSGRGAKYTAGRRPVRLVYQEAFRSVGKALAREYVVKQLTRAQKNALVAGAANIHLPSAATSRRVPSRR
jgi:putative endonuclease